MERPATLQLFVLGSVVATAFSIVRDPGALSFPSILFTLVLLGLLKKLWDGERALWWLFVVVNGAGIALGLTNAAGGEASGWAAVAAGAVGLLLLLAPPTRAWIDERSETEAPAE